MKQRVVYGRHAQLDLADFADWYARRSLPIGERLLAVARQRLERCREFPESAPVFDGSLRRVQLMPFPLSAVYRILDDAIEVVAFIDDRADPQANLEVVRRSLK